MNMIKSNGGFTLVELIVVIAILGILAGTAYPVYSGYIDKANEAADMVMLDSVKTAIVFVAIEEDEGHDGQVLTATVKENSTEVTITGNDALGISTVDVKDYVSSITFKSNATGATWNGSEWTLTYDTTEE